VEGFQRVPIPGQAEVSFAEPGGYTVYVALGLDQAHWALSTRRPADHQFRVTAPNVLHQCLPRRATLAQRSHLNRRIGRG